MVVKTYPKTRKVYSESNKEHKTHKVIGRIEPRSYVFYDMNENTCNSIQEKHSIEGNSNKATRYTAPQDLELEKESKINVTTPRTRENFPDPAQSHRAEVNRIKQQFKMRMDPELIERVNAAAEEAGKTRQDYITDLIINALD